MHDVNLALANLRQATNISTLDFDANGNLSLVFDGETTINFARTSDTTLELWAVVEGLGAADDADVLRRALEANHLGEGTGASRLSLSATGQFVLCRALDVSAMNDAQFSNAIIDVLRYVTFWNSSDANLAGAPSSAPPQETESYIIRG